ncbi:MAG TPA: TrmH family RNA methyltransferase [Candidatus Saccharimonadia bacterium]|jgi:tRNA G18 (ribose-2'-O)-methylase SpoU|nr:TrmH family RNA methyltransferase [Candidatus Saccharimonadia bacterium]
MTKFPLRLILSNVRSAGNVGSILRTADACGVEAVVACGYTPYPRLPGDERPPHVITANTRTIAKTALGAERSMWVLHLPNTLQAIREAKRDGFTVIVLEQAERALNLYDYVPAGPLALVLGNEVEGVPPDEQALAETIIEIPMLGAKESLNVSVAGAIALYQLRFGR